MQFSDSLNSDKTPLEIFKRFFQPFRLNSFYRKSEKSIPCFFLKKIKREREKGFNCN